MAKNTWYERDRLSGLRRFALSLTLFNILGHTLFGFEQSWLHPLVGVAAAYLAEALLELVEAGSTRERPRFLVRPTQRAFFDFFLSAHISGLAASMLLYANDRLLPVAFAAVTAIASKAVFRARVGESTRHYMNPSNFGITVTLLAFPWVGIAPPYQFTSRLSLASGIGLCLLVIVLGTLINRAFTKRLPLIAAWLVGFALQAAVRSVLLDTSLIAGLLPMTGVAFLLFTFYMVTDPATTPSDTRGQVLFAAGMAAAYGLLVSLHVVFGLFFGLTLVCAVRGIALHAAARRSARPSAWAPEHARSAALAPAVRRRRTGGAAA